MPKVLISDKLSEQAVEIFQRRGVEVDFDPGLGKDPDRLAEVIGQTVVAEGVETDLQLQTLRRIGVRSGQGFGIAGAMPIDEVRAYVAKHIGTRTAAPTAPATAPERR